VVISARTRVAGVIGSPVRHSLSPLIHNAAFAAAGLDWTFVAFDVAPGAAGIALDGMRALGLGGLSVTMPHKADAAAAVDERSPEADLLGAVNCIVPTDGGRLYGDSTDGPGFLRALADAGVDPHGRRCCVVGAGGAARAVVLALAGAGASDIAVVNRTNERAERAVELAPAVARAAGPQAVGAADLVVNATPVGMGDDDSLPFEPRLLRRGQIVADLVYEPVETPLLAAAAAAGCRMIDGLGMLIHQAGLAFEAWTGEPAPLNAMKSAVAADLRKREKLSPD
jgi:shikimate dehydrogenase